MATSPIAKQALLSEPELRARLGELYAAVEQFNRRWYFESHETLEDLWMVTPLPERTFFQGIIQLAAAFVHLVRGEYPGILKLLDQAIEKVEEFVPEQFGIETAALLVEMRRVLSEISALGPERFREWDESGAPVIVFRDVRDG